MNKRSYAPWYRVSMRVYEYGFPRMSLLGFSVNRSDPSPTRGEQTTKNTVKYPLVPPPDP